MPSKVPRRPINKAKTIQPKGPTTKGSHRPCRVCHLIKSSREGSPTTFYKVTIHSLQKVKAAFNASPSSTSCDDVCCLGHICHASELKHSNIEHMAETFKRIGRGPQGVIFTWVHHRS